MHRDRVITRTDESGKHDERKSAEFDERMTAQPPMGPGFTPDEAGYGYTCEVWYSDVGDPVPDFVEWRLKASDGRVVNTKVTWGY